MSPPVDLPGEWKEKGQPVRGILDTQFLVRHTGALRHRKLETWKSEVLSALNQTPIYPSVLAAWTAHILGLSESELNEGWHNEALEIAFVDNFWHLFIKAPHFPYGPVKHAYALTILPTTRKRDALSGKHLTDSNRLERPKKQKTKHSVLKEKDSNLRYDPAPTLLGEESSSKALTTEKALSQDQARQKRASTRRRVPHKKTRKSFKVKKQTVGSVAILEVETSEARPLDDGLALTTGDLSEPTPKYPCDEPMATDVADKASDLPLEVVIEDLATPSSLNPHMISPPEQSIMDLDALRETRSMKAKRTQEIDPSSSTATSQTTKSTSKAASDFSAAMEERPSTLISASCHQEQQRLQETHLPMAHSVSEIFLPHGDADYHTGSGISVSSSGTMSVLYQRNDSDSVSSLGNAQEPTRLVHRWNNLPTPIPDPRLGWRQSPRSESHPVSLLPQHVTPAMAERSASTSSTTCGNKDVESPINSIVTLSSTTKASNARPKLPKPVRMAKPPLPDHVRPPIWAASRQEICESLPYFRSYQGGVYFNNDIVRGYLLGGHGTELDIFHHGGRLIISHGGGKNEVESRDALDQQATDISVRALLNTWKQQIPVILLCDSDYRFFPYEFHKVECNYVVLGAYLITHAWPQRQKCGIAQSDVIRWMFMFQWCEGQGDPWWLALPQSGQTHEYMTQLKQDAADNIEYGRILEATPSSISVPAGETCSVLPPQFWNSCSTNSRLNPNEETGLSNSNTTVVNGSMRIVPVLIKAVHHPPSVGSMDRPSIQKPLHLGIEKSCYGCSETSAHVFQEWSCLNLSCDRYGVADTTVTLGPSNKSYHPSFLQLKPELGSDVPCSVTQVYLPNAELYGGVTTNRDFRRGFYCTKCGRVSCRFKWHEWECKNPDCGAVVAIKGRVQTIFELGGIEQKFLTQYKIRKPEIVELVRDELMDSRRGRVITFSVPTPSRRVNIHLITGGEEVASGIFEKYQTHAASNDLFRRWPLKKAQMLKGEMLSNYYSHNAGEPYKYVSGTQQTVSLEESPEAIREALAFVQQRATIVLQSTPDLNEVLSAAYLKDQKMSFHSDDEKGLGPIIGALSMGSNALMHFREKIPFKKKGLAIPEGEAQRPRARVCLTLELRHGDVVVMEGLEVQQHYQHTVVPGGFRIAATCRYIQPQDTKATEPPNDHSMVA